MNILLWTLVGIGSLALLYILLCLGLSPIYNKAMNSVRKAASQAKEKQQGARKLKGGISVKRWHVITGVLVLLWIISLGACSGSSAERDKLNSQLTATKASLLSMTAERDKLKANLADTTAELRELKAKYPPRDFWSVEELVEWLAKDTTDKLASASKDYDMGDAAGRLSDNAMKDGYILSLYPLKIANGYQLQNCAIVSGSAYLVNPMTDGVTQLGTSGIYGNWF